MTTLRARLKAFAAFWYDFVVGDDWRIAAGVVLALFVTWGVSRSGAPAWWILPLGVAVFLGVSLLLATREARARRRR